MTEVALEFSDHLRAARHAGKKPTADMEALFLRLENAQGVTEVDALALLAYSQAIIVSIADPTLESGERVAITQAALNLVQRASTILENITGRMSDEFV